MILYISLVGVYYAILDVNGYGSLAIYANKYFSNQLD